jgi:hypothetical protein
MGNMMGHGSQEAASGMMPMKMKKGTSRYKMKKGTKKLRKGTAAMKGGRYLSSSGDDGYRKITAKNRGMYRKGTQRYKMKK